MKTAKFTKKVIYYKDSDGKFSRKNKMDRMHIFENKYDPPTKTEFCEYIQLINTYNPVLDGNRLQLSCTCDGSEYFLQEMVGFLQFLGCEDIKTQVTDKIKSSSFFYDVKIVASGIFDLKKCPVPIKILEK